MMMATARGRPVVGSLAQIAILHLRGDLPCTGCAAITICGVSSPLKGWKHRRALGRWRYDSRAAVSGWDSARACCQITLRAI